MKMQKPTYTLNCKGRILSIASPIIMGILNATPDSFYDGDPEMNTEKLLSRAATMVREGALILDIGGASSRPGSIAPTEDEECKRVLPMISLLRKNFPDILISVDTFRARVAEQAVLAGADIINDISSARFDTGIIQVAVKYKTPYIAMHMKDTPATMQQNPYYDDVSREVLDFFIQTLNELSKQHLYDVIIDPGFGFGKNVAHNFRLLRDLQVFSISGKPILCGISRKSMICKPLQVSPRDALNGTTALHMPALLNGASILRVHDVREAMQCIKLFEIYSEAGN